jgi:DNA-binding MarR family transcriptional regulator
MSRRKSDPDTTRALAIAGELRVLIGQLKRRLRQQVSLGDLDLTWSQVSVLGHLEREGPATVTSLARAESMRPQSMGANVSALEAAGLVSGAPDPDDGRRTLWSLTATCREWIKAGRAAREDWLSNGIRMHLTREEQQQLAHAVELLKRIAES